MIQNIPPIEHFKQQLRTTYEELPGMLGMTWPPLSAFIQRFCELRLIELSDKHFILEKQKLPSYLDQAQYHVNSRYKIKHSPFWGLI